MYGGKLRLFSPVDLFQLVLIFLTCFNLKILKGDFFCVNSMPFPYGLTPKLMRPLPKSSTCIPTWIISCVTLKALTLLQMVVVTEVGCVM